MVTYESEMSVNPRKATLFKKSLDDLVKAIEQSDETLIYKCVNTFYDDISKAGLGDSVSLNMNYLLFQLIHIASEQDDEVNHEEIMRFIGESSFVKVILKGTKEVVDVTINADSLDKDDIEALQDMLIVAFNDASKKVDKETEKKMSKYGNIPGLF